MIGNTRETSTPSPLHHFAYRHLALTIIIWGPISSWAFVPRSVKPVRIRNNYFGNLFHVSNGRGSCFPNQPPLWKSSSSPSLSSLLPSQRVLTEMNVMKINSQQQKDERGNTIQGVLNEIVPVQIEAPTPNSRRIKGRIIIPGVTIDDVWSLLTDYDNLATHVPNLVESRRVSSPYEGVRDVARGEPGDGRYKCRLYQKGAQKIIGFEFGATVTMDMEEHVVTESSSSPSTSKSAKTILLDRPPTRHRPNHILEKKIIFKCYESQFFSTFDGEWSVREAIVNGRVIGCAVSYTVDVKPRGPVPVAALEWRIREDVPTNLKAVRKAAMKVIAVSDRGTFATEEQAKPHRGNVSSKYTYEIVPGKAFRDRIARRANGKIEILPWEKDETMAMYLVNK